jgi:hypothetical protein
VLFLTDIPNIAATKRINIAEIGQPGILPFCIMQVLDIHPLFFYPKE